MKIGIIIARISGSDGVDLETEQWIKVNQSSNHPINKSLLPLSSKLYALCHIYSLLKIISRNMASDINFPLLVIDKILPLRSR